MFDPSVRDAWHEEIFRVVFYAKTGLARWRRSRHSWIAVSAKTERQVAEVAGEYGPVAVAEVLIQKLWLRGDFRREGLRTRRGERVRVVHPGTWNRLGGPDFKGAELEIGERRVVGDVEMHFYQRDWMLHGHHENHAFDGVVLHVLVFEPPEEAPPVRTRAGTRPEECVLAPLMATDLESYAEQDALRQLEERDLYELAMPLLELPVEQRRALLREEARRRWEAKVSFAAARVSELGWREACHQMALTTLGHARNRRGMHAVAQRVGFAAWRRERPLPEALAADDSHNWVRSGIRPASQPLARLRQYAQWMERVGDWPDQLKALARTEGLGGVPEESTAAYRRRVGMRAQRDRFAARVAGGTLRGTRWDTLLVDVFFPLCATRHQSETWATVWYHWFPGDMPERFGDLLRVAGLHRDGRAWPLCNGSYQGVLRWLASR